ncbi:MAG: hypothetical protein IKO23_06680 [Bacteroidales bacterium]|nr:hypothetical protein [Bacteroidales bacterium]
MKKIVLIVGCLLCLFGCVQKEENKVVLHREFYETLWERFDYVQDSIDVKAETTYDLSLKIAFTDDYSYKDFSMVFTVFSSDGEPYRSKTYKFNLKDDEGNWNVEKVDGCHTFVLPINKSLRISEVGTYLFQIENRMPITPLVGVKELTLLNE